MEPIKKIISSNDLKIVLIAIMYFAFANIGIWLSFPISKAAPLWPPSGLALALVLLLGYRTWPAITIGSLIASALVFLHIGVPFTTSSILSLSIIAIGNTLECLFGYFLIYRIIKTKNPFLKTSNVFIFLFVALVTCLIGATAGTFGLSVNDMVSPDNWTFTFATWWVGNVVSVLIVTPFIISWTSKMDFKLTKQNVIESLIFLSCFVLVLLTLKLDSIAPTIIKSFPFIITPFLLWLGYRFSLQVTTAGILAVSFIAIYYTINNLGPFVLDTEANSLIILQIFIGLISVSTIILYATTYERTIAQVAMQDFNEKLELKVAERTKKLKEEIATRESAEKKLQTTNSKLRKTNTELDNFVYRVSHDLRAPIASVLGLTHLAKNENKVAELKNYFELIADSATQQDEFIKEILDLSRNARLEVQKDKIKFKSLLNEVFDLHMHSNVDKNVVKEIEVDEQHPFVSDKSRLKVILNNLVSNSIRHSNGHDPVIKIGVTTNKKEAKITINDNGKGIPKKHIKNVFRMFYRATDVNAGSGLGLYIVKETMDKLAGNIALESKEKEGTSVHLEIPNLKA